MRDLAVLFLHLLATVARLAGPGGARAVVAESVLVTQQLLILNRSRKRSLNLRLAERLVASVCTLLMRPSRLVRSAIVLKPSTLLRLHHKMSADMAVELAPYGAAVVSLYPGLVRTEKVMEASAWLDLTNSESPEFVGRAVAALATDPNIMNRTGTVQVAARVAREYAFTDIDGKAPRPLTLADV